MTFYVDNYVNNSEDAKSAADSYDTYIGVELNLPDANRNAVYGRVKKQVWNDDGQSPNDRLPTFPSTQSPTTYIC